MSKIQLNVPEFYFNLKGDNVGILDWASGIIILNCHPEDLEISKTNIWNEIFAHELFHLIQMTSTSFLFRFGNELFRKCFDIFKSEFNDLIQKKNLNISHIHQIEMAEYMEKSFSIIDAKDLITDFFKVVDKNKKIHIFKEITIKDIIEGYCYYVQKRTIFDINSHNQFQKYYNEDIECFIVKKLGSYLKLYILTKKFVGENAFLLFPIACHFALNFKNPALGYFIIMHYFESNVNLTKSKSLSSRRLLAKTLEIIHLIEKGKPELYMESPIKLCKKYLLIDRKTNISHYSGYGLFLNYLMNFYKEIPIKLICEPHYWMRDNISKFPAIIMFQNNNIKYSLRNENEDADFLCRVFIASIAAKLYGNLNSLPEFYGIHTTNKV